MPKLNELLDRLWTDYLHLNPDARRIRELVESRGETIVNDHIAFRTFNDPHVNIDVLARPFLEEGYVESDARYHFTDKKLDARHFEHPDPKLPRIFISELRTGDFSPGLRDRVKALLEQVPAEVPAEWDFTASGRPWSLTHADYEALRAESEYAAWMAAFGFRPNHFTISVNGLKTFRNIQELVEFLQREGFELNTSGGVIKGSPEDYLEQASTLANKVQVEFRDGVFEIPSCYYEFAQRHAMPDGKLFNGFIEKSANRIFESTDKR